MTRRLAIGVDFGTESARALLVDCADGAEVASAVYAYENGVIDERLPAPDDDVALGVDWALQDPADSVPKSTPIASRRVMPPPRSPS